MSEPDKEFNVCMLVAQLVPRYLIHCLLLLVTTALPASCAELWIALSTQGSTQPVYDRQSPSPNCAQIEHTFVRKPNTFVNSSSMAQVDILQYPRVHPELRQVHRCGYGVRAQGSVPWMKMCWAVYPGA